MKSLDQLLKEFGTQIVTLRDGQRGLLRGINVTAKELTGDQPIVSFIASDATVDRYNEVILPSAWADMTNFRRNPVITDCHNYSSIGFILGRAIRCEVKNNRLEDDVLFAVDNPLGKIGYDMARQGFCPTQSVGFIPEEWNNGNEAGKPDRTYTKCDLLEIALTVVPANPGASNLSKAFEAGALDKSDLRDLQSWLKQFCSDPQADPAAKASASGAGVHDAQLLQIARDLKQIFKRA